MRAQRQIWLGVHKNSKMRPDGVQPATPRRSVCLRRTGTLCILTVLLFTLPGCWDYEPINMLSAVVGVGVDPVPDDPEKIRITIQYPLFSAGAGAPGVGSSTPAVGYQILSEDGYSVEETFKHLQLKMNKRVDPSQLRSIVFSEKLSPELMDSVVGQLIRHPKLNRLCYAFATPESAADLFAAKPVEGAPMSFVSKQMAVRQNGYVVRKELWEYWRDATQLGVTPVLPVVVSTQAGSNAGEAEALTINGTAVYENNRTVLMLSPKETLSFNLMRGQVRNMAVDVPLQKGIADLTDVHASSRLRCIGVGQDLQLIDRVSVQATIGKIAKSTTKPMPLTDVNGIESVTSRYLGQQLLQTTKQLQEHGVDSLGFGRIYLQRHPEQEQVIRQHWGEMFRHAKVDIQVNVDITSKGSLI